MLVLDRYQEICFASDIKKEVEKYEINFERELWRTILLCKGCFHAHTTLWIRKSRSKICIWHSECKMGLSAALLGLCLSPVSPRHLPPRTEVIFLLRRNPRVHEELSDHMLASKTMNNLQKLRQVEKRLFPWHNLINAMHCSFGKPAVMWEGALSSPDNYRLFGVWNGMGGRIKILKSILIL